MDLETHYAHVSLPLRMDMTVDSKKHPDETRGWFRACNERKFSISISDAKPSSQDCGTSILAIIDEFNGRGLRGWHLLRYQQKLAHLRVRIAEYAESPGRC